MPLFETIFDRDEPHAKPALTPPLRELYAGDLHFPEAADEPTQGIARPYVFANFVSTLDGVTSFKLPGQSSGANISAYNSPDRFIMGLLRASADAVLVGARTIHDTSSTSRWIPPETYPGARDLFRDYRSAVLHKSENPLVVIVSGSGKLDLSRAVFQSSEVRKLLLTTAAGKKELNSRGAPTLPAIEVRSLADSGWITPAAILDLLGSQFGVRRLLHEGGPTLFGQFLAAKAVDEFFLTLAPQVAGRLPGDIRPAVVESVEFTPDSAPWFELLSVKQAANYLYLRYRRARPHEN